VPPFAVVDRDKEDSVDGVLMIIDERGDAEEIAFELRQAGIRAEVVPTAGRSTR
jgi:hypothetical protein